MTRQSSPSTLNYSRAFLVGGLGLSLLSVMLRPANAEATLPRTVDVFDTARADTAPVAVRLSDLPIIKDVDYSVILHGRKKATTVSLSGVPLLETLKAAGVKTDSVNFMKIRYGTTDDSAISLVALNQADVERPPMILESGKRPGLGPFRTPAILPGQPDITKPIREDSFVAFSATGARLKLIPGAPGAKIMTIAIYSKKRKNGQYSFTARVRSGDEAGARMYQWYGYDSKGQPRPLGTTPSLTTTDATVGSSRHQVSVVVTERGTGSTGTRSVSYFSRKRPTT